VSKSTVDWPPLDEHLIVRSLVLLEAFETLWGGQCSWYMKADADSFIHVEGYVERLSCFNSSDLLYLGSPHLAGGLRKSVVFASGGAGYVFSRALAPKIAYWSKFCLLEHLQNGGIGMEDVAVASCLLKWGHIPVRPLAPLNDYVTSRAGFTRSNVLTTPAERCYLTVHSLGSDEIRRVYDMRWQGRCQVWGSEMEAEAYAVVMSNIDGDAMKPRKFFLDYEYEVLLRCSYREIKKKIGTCADPVESSTECTLYDCLSDASCKCQSACSKSSSPRLVNLTASTESWIIRNRAERRRFVR